MDKEETIDILKSYVPPKYYDLNDFDRIYERRQIYDEDIYLYKLSFVDVYLYSDGELFDINVYDGNLYFRTSDYADISEDESKIISELKSICNPRNYESNDWKSIIDKSITFDDGTSAYKTSDGTIYLDKNYDFYDIDPIEVDKSTNILYVGLSDDELSNVSAIKKYILPKHYDLINWKVVLSRVKNIKDNINLYNFGFMDLYLDDDLNVVSYDRCHIIDGQFWYDFTDHSINGDGQYTYIGDL